MYTFIDTNTYEQVELSKGQIADTLPYLKDSILVKVLSYKDKIFGVESPTFVELKITYTKSRIKETIATGTTKLCTV